MPKTKTAGDLYEKIAFDRRQQIDRGDGVTVGEWQEFFVCRAAFTHLRSGEAVMADRLQGQHSQIITVRASSETRQVTTDFRVRDLRTGETKDGKWTGVSYNVKDITPSADRQWLDILCQSGGADG